MRTLTALATTFLTTAICFADADDHNWNNIAGGDFHQASNWLSGVVPDFCDVARFDLNANYPVSFNRATTLEQLAITRGHVTFDLSGHALTLTDPNLTGGASFEVRSDESLSPTALSVLGAGSLIGEYGIFRGAIDSEAEFTIDGQGQPLSVTFNVTFETGAEEDSDTAWATVNLLGEETVLNADLVLLSSGLPGTTWFRQRDGSLLSARQVDVGRTGSAWLDVLDSAVMTDTLRVGTFAPGGLLLNNSTIDTTFFRVGSSLAEGFASITNGAHVICDVMESHSPDIPVPSRTGILDARIDARAVGFGPFAEVQILSGGQLVVAVNASTRATIECEPDGVMVVSNDLDPAGLNGLWIDGTESVSALFEDGVECVFPEIRVATLGGGRGKLTIREDAVIHAGDVTIGHGDSAQATLDLHDGAKLFAQNIEGRPDAFFRLHSSEIHASIFTATHAMQAGGAIFADTNITGRIQLSDPDPITTLHIHPNTPGAMTIDAQLELSISGAGTNDQIVCEGGTIDGNLRIDVVGGFPQTGDSFPIIVNADSVNITSIYPPNLYTIEQIGNETHLVVTGCYGDFDNNGTVNIEDVLALLAAWGPCDCLFDMDLDGFVSVEDLLVLLANWGDC